MLIFKTCVLVVGEDTTLAFWWFSKRAHRIQRELYSQLWFIALKGYTANSAEGREKKHQIIPEGIQEQTSKVLHHTVTEDRTSCTERASSAWEICSTYLVFLPKETCLKLKSPEILLKAGHISTLCLDNWALLPKFQTPRSKVVVYHESHCLHKQHRRLV